MGTLVGYSAATLVKADLSGTLMVISSASAAVAAMLMVWVGVSANAVSKRMLEVAQLAKDMPLTVEAIRERFELLRISMRFFSTIISVSQLRVSVDVLQDVAAEWMSFFTAIAPGESLPFKKGEEKDSLEKFVKQARVLYKRKESGERIKELDYSNLRGAASESARSLAKAVDPFVKRSSASSVLREDVSLAEK